MSVEMTMPILVVDDYNTMVRIVRNLLRQLGFQNVDEASDGKTALAKMRSRAYGLVISDWRVGAQAGDDLVREVRADERLKNTPVLMLTQAEGNGETSARAENTLAKPFNAQQLKKRLAALLGEEF
ncbi:MAG: response regulator [Hyphomonadaceae bacterium]